MLRLATTTIVARQPNRTVARSPTVIAVYSVPAPGLAEAFRRGGKQSEGGVAWVGALHAALAERAHPATLDTEEGKSGAHPRRARQPSVANMAGALPSEGGDPTEAAALLELSPPLRATSPPRRAHSWIPAYLAPQTVSDLTARTGGRRLLERPPLAAEPRVTAPAIRCQR